VANSDEIRAMNPIMMKEAMYLGGKRAMNPWTRKGDAPTKCQGGEWKITNGRSMGRSTSNLGVGRKCNQDKCNKGKRPIR
jgi:hypothetical protein